MIKRITFLLLLPAVLLSAIPGLAQEKDGYITNPAFSFRTDKGLLLNVQLLSDPEKMPALYAAQIITTVCSDSLCKPVNLRVYWNLLGHFVDYKTPENQPLTKFDHVVFTAADHKKLHVILADDRSMLKDYEAEDMIDRSVKVYSGKVDGVTGATSKSFQDVVVPGAVYTVHTLWHIVNGPVAARILEHTRKLLDDRLIRSMLTSGNVDYQRFILTELPDAQLKNFVPDIIGLIAGKDEWIPLLALEKIPGARWKDAAAQQLILHNFPGLRLEVQNTLLQKLKEQPLHTAALKILVHSLDKLDKHQVDKVFDLLATNILFIDEALEKDLSAQAGSNPLIAPRVDEILKSARRRP
ncbi:hypothetical protein [Niabella sp.]|uniref:hypothetical protein n=1 Tax=Niabella sp. TaxID=1962976 RepID=UPI00261F52E6|nr:hypothetical protein [Niabella sp.]